MDSVFSRSTQPDRPTWLALAERCEKATGPDPKLDAAMDLLVGNPQNFFGPAFGTDYVDGPERHDGAATWAGGGRRYYAPPYTASLDAITALIERELPGWRWKCGRSMVRGWATLYGDPTIGVSHSGTSLAGNVALALCAAFCRAMAEKAGA